MRAVISKWGNSPAVRLPKGIMETINLSVGQAVEIVAKNDRIEITPIAKSELTLEELLNQITPQNLHQAADWGKPVGKEVW